VAHADRYDALQPIVLSGGRFEHRIDPEVVACRVDFLALFWSPYEISGAGRISRRYANCCTSRAPARRPPLPMNHPAISHRASSAGTSARRWSSSTSSSAAYRSAHHPHCEPQQERTCLDLFKPTVGSPARGPEGRRLRQQRTVAHYPCRIDKRYRCYCSRYSGWPRQPASAARPASYWRPGRLVIKSLRITK
jgi:hypothetical protein